MNVWVVIKMLMWIFCEERHLGVELGCFPYFLMWATINLYLVEKIQLVRIFTQLPVESLSRYVQSVVGYRWYLVFVFLELQN